MESMRSLNTSLPRSGSPRQASRPPPSELLQAFKSAALSVTQLYKSATAEHDAAREAGYQDALDDLLVFLDQQNLGLGDGEGWKVRQWATERLSPAATAGYGSENDMEEDESHAAPRDNVSIPAVPTATPQTSTQAQQAVPQKTLQTEEPVETIEPERPSTRNEREVFHFRAQPASVALDGETPLFPPSPAIRLEVKPNSRHRNTRDRGLGHGAGSKRKFNIPDFFDLSGLSGLSGLSSGAGKDGTFGGGGRGASPGSKRSKQA